ncbi:MAG: MlaD family protein [Planctomycetota bacterium]|nr:MlaD family protein [Planctomycetota bacterium]MDI6786743.1 MlaD family protein [Planctomycetota bacterium]
MQTNIRKEMVLGALFIVAIVLLIFVSITISKLNIFSSPQYIKVVFEDSGGLKKGDTVRVLGMTAGVVYRLKLLSDNRIKVFLKLSEPVEIREDYRITVEESSMLGGNFVGINPGTPGKQTVHPKATLKGKMVLPGLDALTKFIQDNQKEVKEFFEQGIKVIKETAEGKGTLGKLLTDEELYTSLKETSQSLKNTIEKIESGEGSAGKFINDDRLYIDLKDSVESLKKTVKEVESGKGFLGKLIYDEKLSTQVSDVGDSAIKLIESAVRTKVFAGVDVKYYPESIMSVSNIFMKIQPRESKYFILGGSVLSLDRDGDIKFEEQRNNKDQTFIKANVQIAYKFLDNKVTFRTGLIEGKFGGALDYNYSVTGSLVSGISLSLEGRDSYNDLRREKIDEELKYSLVRVYGSVKFGNHLRIFAGGSRLFNGTPELEFIVGVSFEYLDEDIKNFVTLLGLSR